MKRLRKILLISASLILVWALVNPYLFTMKETDASARYAYKEKGLDIRLGDYKYKNNKLHFASIGDSTKPVILFIHGSPGSWVNSWDYFMDSSWHKNYELISVDRPGFGKSDYGQAKNLFEQSETISAFVKDKLSTRNITLIGHSYGGPLVLQLCADNDSLYNRCIIMAGSVSAKAEKKEWQLNLFSHRALNWLAPGSFEQGILELLWLKEDLKTYDSDLSKIKTPIIGIYGTDDNMVPYQPNVDFLREKFDSTQLTIKTMEGADHFLPWNKYAEMKKIICTN